MDCLLVQRESLQMGRFSQVLYRDLLSTLPGVRELYHVDVQM